MTRLIEFVKVYYPVLMLNEMFNVQ